MQLFVSHSISQEESSVNAEDSFVLESISESDENASQKLTLWHKKKAETDTYFW